MQWSKMLVGAAALAAVAAVASAEDYDVSPKIDGGVIKTNAFFDADEIEVENVSVFFYQFGEDPILPPNELADPGFHPLPGSGFALGSQIGLDTTGVLNFWDGSGAPVFAPAGAGTSLSYKFGTNPANSATVTGTAIPTNDVLLGPVDAVGEFDDHLDTDITLSAPAGVYYFTGRVNTTMAGVTPSDTIHLLFGYGVEEETLLSAAFFVRDTFAPGTTVPIPEPAALGVLAAGLPLLVRQRRG